MARRNPMNQRYQGEGPEGKTKKSATSAKPKTEAASSVRIPRKPVTAKEKKAELKRREQEEQRKAEEKARKAKEREEAALKASGIEPEPEKKTSEKVAASVSSYSKGLVFSVVNYIKEIFTVRKKPEPDQESTPETADEKVAAKPEAAKAPTSTGKGLFGGPKYQPDLPQTSQYSRLKNMYWGLLAIAMVCIIGSFMIKMEEFSSEAYWYGMIAIGYGCAISAIILDYAKIKKLEKAHLASKSNTNKSPKQIKHESRAKATAEAKDINKDSKSGKTEKQQSQSKEKPGK